MRSHYKYPDGADYDGEWSNSGQRDGLGKMTFPDGSQFVGRFENGMCSGLGIMVFKDGSRYEGEFLNGKFGGTGVFIRGDGMRYEGEFRDGKIWGLGLLTFADGTHGLPRNEGYFESSKIIQRKKCPDVVHKAIQAAERARSQQV